MMFFILGIIALVALWIWILYKAIRSFLLEDFRPLYLTGVIFFLYFFAKAIYAIAFGA